MFLFRGREGHSRSLAKAALNCVKSAGIIKDAKAIYYPGAPHGLTATHQDEVNSELLNFLEG